MKLVVLAAGIGSRFGGVKQMAGVGPRGEALLEYNLFDAVRAGFDSAVFLLRKDIEADFRARVLSRLPTSIGIEIAFQDSPAFLPPRAKPWGTGHALLCTESLVGKNAFAVVNADDYYGARAFREVGAFLAGGRGSGAGFCMAAYRLGDVVPPTGTVSRAVCDIDEKGNLRGIAEKTRVRWAGDHLLSTEADGSEETLAADLPVSMNLWGLTPEVFPEARRRFEGFLKNKDNLAKAEFYLPDIIGGMIADGLAQIRAFRVAEPYFGLTNPADLAHARASILSKISSGTYHDPLWGQTP